MKSNVKTHTFSLDMEETLMEDLLHFSKQENRNITMIISEAVRDYIRRNSYSRSPSMSEQDLEEFADAFEDLVD